MNITDLPEECIFQIVSYTSSPKDACRYSLVHPALRAVADSDEVWKRFFPSDYKEIISQSSSPHLIALSKKSLFFHLCDHPVLLADNFVTFALEKQTGKKCYMLGSRGLVSFGEIILNIGNGNPCQSPDFPKLQNSQLSGGLKCGAHLTLSFYPQIQHMVCSLSISLEEES
ncbi:hypothetical protein L6164_013273 [Bauhinia variegata]|uniref:Uncharacterized protein n=1 Tax=Bauhinia variegata TaxID=167791 RepID=A0ACB9PFD1_BAUVA|nr:hypothetical protein L6164_013273 [Bauhinia variegata]